MVLVQELRAGVFTQEEWNTRIVSLTYTQTLFRIFPDPKGFCKGLWRSTSNGKCHSRPQSYPQSPSFLLVTWYWNKPSGSGDENGEASLFNRFYVKNGPCAFVSLRLSSQRGWGTLDFKWWGCMIEWGQTSTTKKSLGLPEKPQKFRGPILTPQKSHAEFPSLKNFEKTKH